MLLSKRCFALLFLSFNSLSTKQWQILVKNSSLHWLAKRKVMQLWNNQSQLLHPVIWWIFKDDSWPMSKHREACCRTTRNDWKIFRISTNWASCVQIQDSPKLLRLDSVACRRYTLPRDDISPTPKRIDEWRYKEWSSVESGDQLSSKKAWSWDQDRFCIWRRISLVDQVRERSDRGNTNSWRWWE